jgi:hypothetical protein
MRFAGNTDHIDLSILLRQLLKYIEIQSIYKYKFY